MNRRVRTRGELLMVSLVLIPMHNKLLRNNRRRQRMNRTRRLNRNRRSWGRKRRESDRRRLLMGMTRSYVTIALNHHSIPFPSIQPVDPTPAPLDSRRNTTCNARR